MTHSIPKGVARRGRGTTFDPPNRFAPSVSEAVDDGWWQAEAPVMLATEVRDEASKSAPSWGRSPDLGFDRSLNLYRGCEHGCIYCYARPSHAYWDLSPGLDFETRLIARTASPQARLRDMRELSAEGVPVGALISPLIPGLNDHELEHLLDAAYHAGARTAAWMPLRLPHEVAPLFEDWLQTHYPEHAGKGMSLIRQCRGGRDYDARFGNRLRGEGGFAELLEQRFQKTSRRLGMGHRSERGLDVSAFRPPHAQGDLFF